MASADPFHPVSPRVSAALRADRKRTAEFLAALDLPADALERSRSRCSCLHALRPFHELELGLRRIARHQAGCQALMTQYGSGLTPCHLDQLATSRACPHHAKRPLRRIDIASIVLPLLRVGSSPAKLTHPALALYQAAQSAPAASPTTRLPRAESPR